MLKCNWLYFSDHCMMNFVKPSYLGTLKEFSNRFINPIANGQCNDSGPYDVQLMKRISHILHKKLEGFVQVNRRLSFLQHILT